MAEWADADPAGLRRGRASTRPPGSRPSPGAPSSPRPAITLYRSARSRSSRASAPTSRVDGGMSDNPRPVLYGSGYEAFLPRARRRAAAPSRSAWSASTARRGDVVVPDATCPADLAVGDILATPVTGAYGYSMASNYNKVPRPAVVFVGRRRAPGWSCGGRPTTTCRASTPEPRAARRGSIGQPVPCDRHDHRPAADSSPTTTAPVRVALLGLRQRRRRAGRASADPTATTSRPGPASRLELVGVAVADPTRARVADACPPTCSPTTPTRWSTRPTSTSSSSSSAGIDPARELDRGRPAGGQAGGHRQQGAAGRLRGRAGRGGRRRTGVDLLYEAAVAGAIPLIRPLRESLAGERIVRVMGIVNGTTNYILTRMTEDGRHYAEALAEARPRASPSATRRPTSRATTPRPRRPSWPLWPSARRGRRRRAPRGHHRRSAPPTSAFADRLGYVGQAAGRRRAGRRRPATISVRVHPAMVPRDPPAGLGAGRVQRRVHRGRARRADALRPGRRGGPTASAVLGDLVDAARNLRAGRAAPAPERSSATVRPHRRAALAPTT